MIFVYILENVASLCSASRPQLYRSEVSEGCRAVAHRAKADRLNGSGRS
jgi:hypothetical protein